MNRVAQYYDQNAESEWDRLERHRVEYAMTLKAMEEHLPPAPARIIDIGGACGRYSIELSRRGYGVTLVDISKDCLDLAETKASEAGVEFVSRVQADGRDLSQFKDRSFNAVLLMGPMYHLLTHEDRLQALREAHRILKPSGIIFTSFICKHAVIQCDAKRNPEHILEHREELETILKTGVYRKPDDRPAGFIDSWFAHPTDISPLMAEGGFQQTDLIACEPLVNENEEAINTTSGEVWDAWMDVLYRISKDPSIHGASGHLLFVGRRG